jgi:ABC-2 type transport system permease protein
VFSILGPILFLVFAIGAGGRAIAGEEESGTLDLLLSTPVRRRQVLVDKTLGIGLALIGLGAVLWIAIVLFGPAFQLHVALSAVAAGTVMLVLLGAAFGAVALAVGTATGHKGLADAAAGGFALVTYIVNAVAPQVDALRGLRPICPFRWYLDPDPLKTGLHAANIAVLVTIIVAGLAVALFMFDRRDLAA